MIILIKSVLGMKKSFQTGLDNLLINFIGYKLDYLRNINELYIKIPECLIVFSYCLHKFVIIINIEKFIIFIISKFE